MADPKMQEAMVRMILHDSIGDNLPTEADIKKAIESAAGIFSMDAREKEYIERVLQSSYKVRMDLGEKTYDPNTYHPWIAHRKSQIDFYYWDRYSMYLLNREGWPLNIVKSLNDVSDNILDLCGNPAEKNPWQRKGLVLGDVQSGKTSNYLALCNKAADTGYKVIILLTGTTEGLRKQTQERVDAGFVGLNSRNVLQKNPEKKYIGVGKDNSKRTAYQFTDVISDFNMDKLQSLNFTIKGLQEPVILVLKKNKSILENLAIWLRTRNTDRIGEKIDLPLLLIDDEADNASVNTNKVDKDPTTINRAIVDILKLFKRFSYVAVTATPFANIFIDPDLDKDGDQFNLFPSDFIYALSAPTNYIGARNIFSPRDTDFNCSSALESIDDVLIDLDEKEYVFRSKAKTAHVVPYLPNSLKKAIRYFLLINVVRDLDGVSTTHRSMLINVSPFVDVQLQVYNLVRNYLLSLQSKIQSYSKLGIQKASQHKEIQELLNTWNEFSLSSITKYTENQILDALYEGVSPVQVRLVNGKAKEVGIERLDYVPYKETGLRVIAVGGNSLSRGLTLEGLCVSYFDRNSQMYDTLMQMGRWFGYRKGYEHLFKIWMQPDAMNWYEYISDASDELRDEILEMRRVGLTPKDFGLKVQQNMTSLFVTARSKMRSTKTVEQWINLAAEVVETPRLIADREKCLVQNFKTTCALLEKITNGEGKYDREYNFESNRLVYTKVDKRLIADYIRAFVSHPRHLPFNAQDLSEHIKGSSIFNTWTVAVVGGVGDPVEGDIFPQNFLDHCSQHNVRFAKRIIIRSDNCLLISGDRARVGVPGATKCGLKKNQINDIEKLYFEKNPATKTIPDKPFLKINRDPVLLIYLIQIDVEQKNQRKVDSDKESIELVGDTIVVGIGLGFPGNYEGSLDTSTKVKYVLNSVCDQNRQFYEDNGEDDSSED